MSVGRLSGQLSVRTASRATANGSPAASIATRRSLVVLRVTGFSDTPQFGAVSGIGVLAGLQPPGRRRAKVAPEQSNPAITSPFGASASWLNAPEQFDASV